MLIHEITLRGILSFGPDTPPLPMRPLNVLIGPNGSGKSNLISAIDFLRSSSRKLTAPMRGIGSSGVKEWIWKGAQDGNAVIDVVVDNPPTLRKRLPALPIRHRIEFTETRSRFELVDEVIENSRCDDGEKEPHFFYWYLDGRPALVAKSDGAKQLDLGEVSTDESILSQRKDPDQFPEFDYLSGVYSGVRVYREWTFGRRSVFRSPQPADLPNDRLEEDFSNFGLYLNNQLGAPRTKKIIVDHLRNLYEGLDGYGVTIKGGTVELYLEEQDFKIPASRISDGTLRYLCLLAILCDPEPPPLICIEEPELGLHPDMIPKIADLLISASQRTQLIVTTHSDILIDALTEQPESVVVMEKKDGKTTATRLQASEELQGWLQSNRLGQLWMRGAIGGTRW